ncbi:MAG: glycoside hydrolase family 88 protein [Eubacteriales bacterium]|nr:glycoside hydrolase family 88 protein [Eubacteriales bacterium]MDD4512237.1 glycoside hydrolase family 88 protein [Eubacteriales bacterium]
MVMKDFVNAQLEKAPLYNDKWCYEAGVFSKALIDIYENSGDEKYLMRAKEMVDKFVNDDGSIATYNRDAYNLDNICMGRTALRLYRIYKSEKYLRACEYLLEQILLQPRTPEGGFWHKKIYPNQMWLDGVFMACPFICECAAWTGRSEYFALAAKQIELIYEKTLDESGLCRHAWDSSRESKWCEKDTGRSKHVWGRAMGWYAMAISDVLAVLPKEHKDYNAVSEVYKKLMSAVINNRSKVGLWYQVMDAPEKEGNYLECSCSAMLSYAFIKGARLGLLTDNFESAGNESFAAIKNTFLTADKDGAPTLSGICKVAGLGGTPYRDGSYEYYIGEKVCCGDYKGVAPFMMLIALIKG